MSLRKITLLVVGLTFVGLVAFLTFALETSLLRHFIHVEEQMVYISVQRAVGAVQGDIDHLLASAASWSERDEVIALLDDASPPADPDWLTRQNFLDLYANMIIFIGADGSLVYGQGFDLITRQFDDLPAAVLDGISEGRLAPLAQSTAKAGFLHTQKGPLMLALHPVSASPAGQQPAGAILIGRYLTQSEVLRLSGIIQMPISIEPYNSASLKPDFVQARGLIDASKNSVVIPLEAEQIGGYAAFNDIYDQPAYIISIQQRRVIYQNGQLLMRYLLIALISAGVIFGITTLYILETLVLSRMSRLSREVNQIGASGELSARVTVDRQDELSNLSDNINRMLAFLEETQNTEIVLQNSLSQRLEEQNALYESSKVFLSQIDRSAQLQNICRIAVSQFSLDRAAIYELDEAEGCFRLLIARGSALDHIDLTPQPADDPAPRSAALMRACHQGEAVVDTVPSGGFASAAALPLLTGNGVVMAVVMYSAQPDFFSAARMQTLQAFANLSGMALRSAGLFEQVRQGQDRMEALSRRLVEVQEEERKYIAMELHDEIGQILTGLRLLLNVNIPGAAPRVVENLQQSKDLVNELIVRVRQMSLELRPGLLDDLGLLPALLWHYEGYTRTTGIQVRFQHANLEGRRFSSNIETTAYRVIQEALTNAARYAKVNELTVWCGVLENKLMIEICDDGLGFDANRLQTNGTSRGLLGMRERVKFVGGTLTVESAPGQGTRIHIHIPLESSMEATIP